VRGRLRTLAAAVVPAAAVGLVVSLASSPAGAVTVDWQPTAIDSGTEVLTGVAALGADEAWASGFGLTSTDEGGLAFSPLVRRWDGIRWLAVPFPGRSGQMNAIAARSADDVWAVGDTSPASAGVDQSGVVSHWNGATWTTTTLPNPAAAASVGLSGVAAVSPTDVWAVGTGTSGTATPAVIRHWDGRRWVAVRPPAGLGDAYLTAVAAGGTADVWAVGATIASGPAPVQSPLVLHWNGRSWARIALPSTADRGTAKLLAVTAHDGEAWAVGESTTGGALNRRPLAFHLRPRGSSLEPTPAERGQLNAVTTVGGEVWAVGYQYDADAVPHGYGLRRGAAGWQPLPTPVGPDGILQGLTTARDGTVWTVGSQDGHTSDQWLPLAARALPRSH
jgi:hypothetical protein